MLTLRTAYLQLLRWPLWQCGLRPFFLAGAAVAALYVPAWLAVLGGRLRAPAFPGGVTAWHAHELILGFGLASVIGFSLTAVPEFTSARGFGRRISLGLFALWLGARAAAAAIVLIGVWPLALLQTALCLWLLLVLTRAIWQDPARRQLDLWAALAAVLLAATLCSLDLAIGGVLFADPLAGLRLILHLMLLLIVLTLARISMRVVNRCLEEAGAEPDYLARPPRRHIAALLIVLHALAVLAGAQGVAGWLGLGAGAASLGLLGDWPHTRVLARRWVALLYTLPWLLGLGYLLDGAARLGASIPPSAGLHVLAVGALGQGVFVVFCIAGRMHIGLSPDEGRWLPLAALMLLGAALVRALAGMAGLHALPLWWCAGFLWSSGFALWLWRGGVDLARRRGDGAWGCVGPRAPE